MATVLITLGAVAAYKMLSNRRNSKSNPSALIDTSFPKELQSQILQDYEEVILAYTTSKLERHRKQAALAPVSPNADSSSDHLPPISEPACTPPTAPPGELARQESAVSSSGSIDDEDTLLPEGALKSPIVAPKKAGRFSSFFTGKPGLRSRKSSATQPVAGPFDQAAARAEACEALLLMWAVVEVLRRRAVQADVLPALPSEEAVDEGGSAIPVAVADGRGDEIASGGSTKSEGSAGAADEDGTGSRRSSSASTSDDTAVPANLSDVDILNALPTNTLVSLLQMVQACEAILLDRLDAVGPLGERSVRSEAEYSPYIMHKISLGWGMVGHLLEAQSTEELRIFLIENAEFMSGEKEGFLVNDLVSLLKSRDVPDAQLLKVV
ncbi:hypothetical protein HK101_002081 [Irineochytrium annulatum]|nr:hypothetical protein HK101_002081 [Irineochytrium annulatum]